MTDRQAPIPSELPLTLVAGSGRSGTTWLGNIIAGDDCRIMFEPFDERRGPELAGLTLRPYFRPEEPYPQWRETVARILAGEITNEWIDQDLRRLDREKRLKGLVVKDIRINGMLAWLSRNFPCRVVYLLRHPCAVIASRMKLGWDSHLDVLLDQEALMTDYLAPYSDVLLGAKSDAQRHAVMWCAENLIPLRQIRDHDWILCTYEELATEPEKESGRLLDLLGLEMTEARTKAVQEHSRTCSGRSPDAAADFLTEWRGLLSGDDRRDIAAILERFGINHYHVDQFMPLR